MDHPDIAYLDRYAQASFWRPAAGEQHKGARRAGIVGCLFLDTCFGQAKEPPGGEQRGFDGQLNDNYSIEVLVYRKSLISSHKGRQLELLVNAYSTDFNLC